MALDLKPTDRLKFVKLQSVFYVIALIVMLIAILKIAQTIFKPLAIAVVLGFLVYPIYTFLKKLKIPRVLIVFVIFFVLFSFSYLVFSFVYYSVTVLMDQVPYYQKQLSFIMVDILAKYKLDSVIISNIDFSKYIYPFLTRMSNEIIGFASSLVVLFLLLYFLLSEIHIFDIKVKNAFEQSVSSIFIEVLSTINNQISKYLGIKVFVSCLTGFLVFIGLKLFGQDFPSVWAVLTFVFNFIPSIGSILAVFFIMIAALVQFYPNLNLVLYIFIYNTFVQMLIGNILEPKMQGHRLDLSPFLLLCFLFFWGWLWGIVGLLIAYPFTVIIKVIVDNIPYLKPFSVFLSGSRILSVDNLDKKES
ncbi:AI-2E family transporter [Borrelia coriaceae]|uniref:Membrane spanning protein n=1 Tax=Borrelia coriaceae ATCC 43381 TaxID=1408429 RepID=W5ST87_9SPIR|nr:AI-2E family transporter [Borrelia coriaceae]AHH10160.1 Putative membrane spanning protein [Borrelia coriaceae ATCC 43381]UPA15888.1 AI-2E family transporter [Borrelia coriaceae]